MNQSNIYKMTEIEYQQKPAFVRGQLGVWVCDPCVYVALAQGGGRDGGGYHRAL